LLPYTFWGSQVVTQVISLSIVRPLFELMGDYVRLYAQSWIQRPPEAIGEDLGSV
jgi:hypothetical protein